MRGTPARWVSLLVAAAITSATVATTPTVPTTPTTAATPTGGTAAIATTGAATVGGGVSGIDDAGWRAVPARFSPAGARRGVCVDAPLRLVADRPLEPGTSGRIEVHRADGTLTDAIDLADPRSYHRTIGDAVSDTGIPHSFAYDPVLTEGNTATITLHHRLDYGRTYYVTVDAAAFPGFPGIQDPTTWRFRTRAAPPRTGTRRLTVAADGRGDFCTVQGAIDFVPEGNTRPVSIDVRPGTYREIVYVRADRPHLTIRGAGRDRTVIEYANNNRLNGDTALAGSTDPGDVCPRQALPGHDTYNCWRALFGVEAADFRLRDLTLRNTTPYGGSQAEAFRGNADRITLRRVTLDSFQDTLRLQGRGYVTDSLISGDVDFVWGTGAVFIRRTELRSLHGGFVTQARNDGTHAGYVFVDDRLTRGPEAPDASVYLGRIDPTVYPDSQVVFVRTAMDAHVRPDGWQLNNADCAKAPSVRFWEYGSTDPAGAPLDTGARLPCSRSLTAAEASWWSDPAHVLGGWRPR
ncbi:pectinesterase family protein [Actinoallomurus rhizosphaericola]|uniref:pectinesterase family protein n=1 Tax=Actinoallomurus rhizosphaericola TaxID=2952536 RepID=UPI0020926E82|nr:pectinesterase family protein [Actinoallomurus rhizosphaericola]MCO5999915.1 pectinesterase family protein [Actinoallomurus rhizosphaericola]